MMKSFIISLIVLCCFIDVQAQRLRVGASAVMKASQLRFYFVWNQEESLQEVIEKLNMFEQVNLAVEDGKLIVR